jgi:photosystem II stability/assembly factor-like uncharacterized protein
MKNSVRVIIVIAVVNIFCSCKKDKIYFDKIERVESNTTSRLNRIQFLNDTTCIIAGGEKFNKAEILRSTDGGYTWQSFSDFPETNKGQYGFGVSPAGKIWTTGFDGTILESNNDGASWSERRVQNWKYHVALSFVNENRIVLLNTAAQKGGFIIVVDSNLQILKSDSVAFGTNDVQMVNEQTGYIAAYGVILKTNDGGDTWEYLNIKNDNFNALDCKGPDEVWTCGYNGSIYHTTNGGKTWDRLRNGNSITIKKYNLTDIVFKDANNGYAVGEKGLVIYTSNGGKDWKEYNRFTENALRSITICPNGTLLVVGDEGVIYRLHP